MNQNVKQVQKVKLINVSAMVEEHVVANLDAQKVLLEKLINVDVMVVVLDVANLVVK